MLTLAANWTTAFNKATVNIRILMRLYTGVGTYTSYTNGTTAITDAIPVIDKVSMVDRKLDPIKAVTAISRVNVVLHMDGHVRNLLTGTRLWGKRVEFYVGTDALDAADFAPYFVGCITNVIPDANTLTLQVDSVEVVMGKVSRGGSFCNKHPIEVMLSYLSGLNHRGAEGAPEDMIDAASFDPSLAAFEDVGHLVVNRGTVQYYEGTLEVQIPEKPAAVLSELARIVNASVIVHENGQYTLKRFDPTEATVADWTEDDLGDVEITSLYEHFYSEVRIYSHAIAQNEGSDFNMEFKYTDLDSRGAYSYFGDVISDEILKTLEFENKWCGGSSLSWAHSEVLNHAAIQMELALTPTEPGVGDYLVIVDRSFTFAGTRWEDARNVGQESWATCSTDRPVYLQVDDEIFKCDEFVRIGNTDLASGVLIENANYIDDPWERQYVVSFGAFRISERGALGTNATYHSARGGTVVRPILDITALYYMAKWYAERFNDGAPTIRCTTSLRQYHVQLGDFVSLTTSRVPYYGHNTLTTATKWQVIGKKLVLDSDPPRIEWTVMYAYESGHPAVNESIVSNLIVPYASKTGEAVAANGELTNAKYIVSGFELTTSLLVGTIASGVASFGMCPSISDIEQEVYFTPQADNYLFYNIGTTAIVTRAVQVGLGAPDTGAHEVLIYVVGTDSVGAVFIDDRRVSAPLKGGQIQARSIGTRTADPNQQLFGLVPNSNFSVFSRGEDYPPDSWGLYLAATSAEFQAYKNGVDVDTSSVTWTLQTSVGFTPGFWADGYDCWMAIATRQATDATSITQTNATWTLAGSETNSDTHLQFWQGNFGAGAPGATATIAFPSNTSGVAVLLKETTGNASVPASPGFDTATATGTSIALPNLANAFGSAFFIAAFSREDGDTDAAFGAGMDGWNHAITAKGTESPDATKQTLSLWYMQTKGAGTYNGTQTLNVSDDAAAAIYYGQIAASGYPVIEDTTLWTDSGADQTVYFTDNEVLVGNKALRIRNDGSEPILVISELIPVTSGRLYQLLVRYRVNSANCDSNVIIVGFNSAQEGTATQGSVVLSTGTLNAWVETTLAVVIDAASSYVRMVVSGDASAAGCMTDIDRVSFQRVGSSIYVYGAAAQTIASSAQDAVQFDTEVTDLAGEFSSYFTATVSGTYSVSAAVDFLAIPDNGSVQLFIMGLLSGTVYVTGPRLSNVSGSTSTMTATVSAIVEISAGNGVYLEATPTGGGGPFTLGNTATTRWLRVQQITEED